MYMSTNVHVHVMNHVCLFACFFAIILIENEVTFNISNKHKHAINVYIGKLTHLLFVNFYSSGGY